MRAVIGAIAGASVLAAFVLGGCPGPKATPDAGLVATSTVPASQPSSQPGSGPASMPADHSTSTTPQTLGGLFQMPETPSNVVAVVGPKEITRDDLETALRQLQIQLKAVGLPPDITRREILQAAVDQLMETELKKQIAKELNVKADPKDVAEFVSGVQARMDRDPAFAAFLGQAGITEERMKEDGEFEALMYAINTKLTERVETRTSTTLQAYYDSHKKDFYEHNGVEVWRIFVKAPAGMIQRDRDLARARAEDIHKQAMRQPNRFTDIAMTKSEGGMASTGGYLGFVTKGTLNKELEDKLFAAKPNTILPLYEDSTGFFIYKVGKQRPDRQRPFNEVKGEIFVRLYRPMLEKELQKEMQRLKSQREYKVMIPELEAAAPKK